MAASLTLPSAEYRADAHGPWVLSVAPSARRLDVLLSVEDWPVEPVPLVVLTAVWEGQALAPSHSYGGPKVMRDGTPITAVLASFEVPGVPEGEARPGKVSLHLEARAVMRTALSAEVV